MSSKFVRDSFNSFIGTGLPSENIIDLTAQGKEMQDFLAEEGLTLDDTWLGLQFQADPERPITVPATNSTGKYREDGIVFVHIVSPIFTSTSTLMNGLLDRAEAIKNLFRGIRIGDIIIETVGQPNFESGATLEFEGGFQSCSIIINYQYDINL